MNYCWNWLIAYSYQRGLINREKFISLWRTVQHLDEMRNGLQGRRQNDRSNLVNVRGRRSMFRCTSSIQQSAAMEILS